MPISKKQISLIHVAKNQLHLSDEEYRSILWHKAGVESSKHLDNSGFENVMQYMAALGFRSDFTKRFYGHRPGMASPLQISLIRKLWQEYTNGTGTDITLGKWLNRTFKVSALRFVTKEHAQKSITALRAMKRKAKNVRQKIHS